MTEAPAPSVGDGPAIGAGQLGVLIDTEPGGRGMGVNLTGARLAEATPTHGAVRPARRRAQSPTASARASR
jgi:hypothetical protein